MLIITDFDNQSHPLIGVKRTKSKLNGSETLELKLPQQNHFDISKIERLMKVEYRDIEYIITNVTKKSIGQSFTLEVGAVTKFQWDSEKTIIHENHDGHHTVDSFFGIVFQNMDFHYVALNSSPAIQWQGFGKGATVKDMFKRGLDRYGYEFRIQGNVVYLSALIGDDTNYIYRKKLNASNISEKTDANGMFTYIEGYGDFAEGEEDYFNNAGLKDSYTSPLADIVGIHEGPPILNGSITNIDTLRERMMTAVNNSLDITVSAKLHDIRRMGYTIAVPKKGDRVFLQDDNIDLNLEIRVYSVDTTYNARDEIIECSVDFGSQNIGERYQSDLKSIATGFGDLLSGRTSLPRRSLDPVAQYMIKSIQDAQSEIEFGEWGLRAINKEDPNRVSGWNSEGMYVSTDGGATPRTVFTADGINTEFLRISFNHIAEAIELTSSGLNFYNEEYRVARMDRYGSHFYQEGTEVGQIGPTFITGTQFRGLRFLLGENAEYMTWATSTGTSETSVKLIWSKGSSGNLWKKGFTFNDPIRFREMIPRNATDDSQKLLFLNYLNNERGDRPSAIRVDTRPPSGGGGGTDEDGDNEHTTPPEQTLFRIGFGELALAPARAGLFAYNAEGQYSTRIDLERNNTRAVIRADAPYLFTTTSTVNQLMIDDNYHIRRITSSKRYKYHHKHIDLDIAEKLLNVTPATWFDKTAVDDYTSELNDKYDDVDEFEIKRKGYVQEKIKPIPGVYAEDVKDAGLEDFVSYNDEGEVDGINNNLWVLLIPLVKEMKQEISDLKEQINNGTTEA